MRQVTGSNLPNSTKKVSIQQLLDGHSFSLPTLPELSSAERLEVEVLTAQTLLVPAELFSVEEAEALLAAAGMAVEPGFRAVWSDPSREQVAVMAIPEGTLRLLDGKFGEVCYTTPLLEAAGDCDKTLRLARRGCLLYIKVYDAGLQLAEVIPAADEAGILYCLDRIGGVFPLADYTLRLSGDGGPALRKLIGKRFKETICE